MKATNFVGRLPGLFVSSGSLLTITVVAFSVAISAGLPARGQTLTTLHNFTGGSDGAYPDGNVVADGSGALYGTTLIGGSSSNGIVYKLTPSGGSWTESILYTFTGGSDGGQPGAGLIFDKSGALFGTTTKSNGLPAGVAFKLVPNGDGTYAYSVIYAFTGGADGGSPNCNLLFDASGNLYGTTGIGGAFKSGVIFKLTPPQGGTGLWAESVLYSLNGPTDGSRPLSGVVQDSAGVLYGTATEGGAHNYGTAFKLTPPVPPATAWTFQLLVAFNGTDGRYPIGGLLINPTGTLYGTTWLGGTNYGVVYQLTPNAKGTKYSETVIYSFSGSDGSNPSSPLVYDSAHDVFYGNTMGFLVGYGNVYKLTPPAVAGGTWTESTLYTFVSGTGDGQTPISSLLLSGRALYSISYYGGTANLGTVYQLTLK